MTDYRLAVSGSDYALCHKLLKEEKIEHPAKLSFPTVMALKDQELTGFLSTHIVNDMIIAGPLVLRNSAPRYWTLIRLIEHYENVMRHAGVSSYIFSVDEKASDWLDKIDKTVELKPYAEQNGRKFYIRNL